MAETAPLRIDVAILGGGIAGLWLLARLRKAGYSALLFEHEALGAGQTIASQGIIHGGLKYALDLKLGGASNALADMPARWRACLAGTGEIDLRQVGVAAERHLFWARKTLASRIAGFFGSKLLRGRVDALDMAQWPAVLQNPDHVGAVYALDEIVLDVPSLLLALSEAHRPWIKKIDRRNWIAPQGDIVSMNVEADGRAHRIEADVVIAAAGRGNEDVLRQLGQPAAAAQRRPLQMVMMDNAPAPLWAHCFDTSDKPRVTVTSHRRADGTLIWYIGGLLAERGAEQSPAELMAFARSELGVLLPHLDLSRSRFSTWRIDRAEGATEDGGKPEGPVLRRVGAVRVVWPTKLAFSPQLADLVLADLPPPHAAFDPADIADWPSPDPAAPPWEAATWS